MKELYGKFEEGNGSLLNGQKHNIERDFFNRTL